MQIEVLYMTILGIHHLVGGAMMMYGFLTGNTAIWIQGAIFDLADAVHDTALMVGHMTYTTALYFLVFSQILESTNFCM